MFEVKSRIGALRSRSSSRSSDQSRRAKSTSPLRNDIVEEIEVHEDITSENGATAEEIQEEALRKYLKDPLIKEQFLKLINSKSLDSLQNLENKVVKYQLEKDNETSQMIASLCRQMDELTAKTSKNEDAIEQFEIEKNRLKSFNADIKYSKFFDLLPPTKFSDTNTLDKKEQETRFLHNFPYANKPKKYDGKNLSIRDFLCQINRAQEKLNLSKEEFISELLASTQSEIREHIEVWKDGGESLEDLYFKLLSMYDTRMTPDQARNQLEAFQMDKSKKLSDITATISRLSTLANSHYPTKSVRAIRANEDSIKTLLKLLPPTSKYLAKSEITKLSLTLDREPHFHELVARLLISQDQINEDIKLHSKEKTKDSIYKFSKPTFNKSKFTRTPTYRSNNAYQPRPKIHITEAKPKFPNKNDKRQDFSLQNKNGNSSFNRNNFNQNSSSNRNNSNQNASNNCNNFNQNRSNNRNSNFRNNKYNNQNSYNSNGYPPRNNSNSFNGNRFRSNNYGSQKGFYDKRPYCSLCGYKTHTAVEGCPYMVTDDGHQLKNISPTSGPCTKCPPNVNPLRHPEQHCPFRPKGPFAFRAEQGGKTQFS